MAGIAVISRTLKRASSIFITPEEPKSELTNANLFDDEDLDDLHTDSESSSESEEDELAENAALKKDKQEEKGPENGPEPDIFIDKLPFCSIVACLCLANLQVLALKVDLDCRSANCERSAIWAAFLNIFTVFFVLEMIVRIYVAGLRRFFLGIRTKVKFKLDLLNCVDFLIVFFDVVDIWMVAPATGTPSGLFMVSGFRVYRIFPCAKLLQLNKSIRELWLVVQALSETLKTLGWVILMLIILTYVAAVICTMAFLGNTNEDYNTNRAEWNFEDYFGTVGGTAMTLFQFATRDKWADSLIWPLMDKHLPMIVFFILFFCFAGMALMNSITAIVVECTLASSKANAAKEEKEREKQDAMVLESLHKIFVDADSDGSGELDREELWSSLHKHRVKDRLKMLQIPFKDLTMLFTLLDADDSGSINCDMFFRGVTRLRGQARASDVHQLSIDLNRCLTWCEESQAQVDDMNDQLASLLDNIGETDIEIVQGDRDDRDPVLANRRARPKEKISDRIRTMHLEKMGQVGSKDPWLTSYEDGPTNQEDESESGNVMASLAKKHAGKTRKSLDDAKNGGKSNSKEKRPLQPPPPPLPDHLLALKDKKEAQKRGRGSKGVKKIHAKVSGNKREYSF
mmetsp:Transcript_25395/g.46062  ORF Transcript_25395/g.46062 Transcript_25395/m.46062 type:complete len:628 (-) Transcript_25395:165-2048(-)